jgi:hypothetical protein
MEFASANPSVVRSVKQRDLLNAWLRVLGKSRTLPLIGDYKPDRVADELANMMGFDVAGEGERARFLITQEGARLSATYGNEHIEPDKRTTLSRRCDRTGPICACGAFLPRLPGAQAADLFGVDGSGRRRQGRFL